MKRPFTKRRRQKRSVPYTVLVVGLAACGGDTGKWSGRCGQKGSFCFGDSSSCSDGLKCVPGTVAGQQTEVYG
jgi:hypothetical protein